MFETWRNTSVRLSVLRKILPPSASCGDAMTPMDVDQLIAGNLSQPELKGHGWVAQIISKAPAGLEQYALHHVARVLASSERAIQSHCDHAP